VKGRVVVIEASVVAGYVIAWVARKARRVGGRLDGEVDAVVDAGLDRLRTAVVAKLGTDPVLADLEEEATVEGGQVSELTRQRVELAITAAARKDDGFGQAVTDLVAQLRAAEQASGVSGGSRCRVEGVYRGTRTRRPARAGSRSGRSVGTCTWIATAAGDGDRTLRCRAGRATDRTRRIRRRQPGGAVVAARLGVWTR
jgi:hypothetical protein